MDVSPGKRASSTCTPVMDSLSCCRLNASTCSAQCVNVSRCVHLGHVRCIFCTLQVVHSLKVDREEYVVGSENTKMLPPPPPAEVADKPTPHDTKDTNANFGITSRGQTRAGTRNQHDSSFALDGASGAFMNHLWQTYTGRQIDDNTNRPSSKVLAPPGGASRGLW